MWRKNCCFPPRVAMKMFEVYCAHHFDWPMNTLGLRLYFAHKRGCKFLIEQPVSSETSLQNQHLFSLLLGENWLQCLTFFQTVMCPLGYLGGIRSFGIFDPWDTFCNSLAHGELHFLWDLTAAPVSKWQCFSFYLGTFYTLLFMVNPCPSLTFCSGKRMKQWHQWELLFFHGR